MKAGNGHIAFFVFFGGFWKKILSSENAKWFKREFGYMVNINMEFKTKETKHIYKFVPLNQSRHVCFYHNTSLGTVAWSVTNGWSYSDYAPPITMIGWYRSTINRSSVQQDDWRVSEHDQSFITMIWGYQRIISSSRWLEDIRAWPVIQHDGWMVSDHGQSFITMIGEHLNMISRPIRWLESIRTWSVVHHDDLRASDKYSLFTMIEWYRSMLIRSTRWLAVSDNDQSVITMIGGYRNMIITMIGEYRNMISRSSRWLEGIRVWPAAGCWSWYPEEWRKIHDIDIPT